MQNDMVQRTKKTIQRSLEVLGHVSHCSGFTPAGWIGNETTTKLKQEIAWNKQILAVLKA